ncbi:helix-turn-helix domain-containing protein [Lysinibacillus sp. fkY74-1]|nr:MULTISPECIES: helix-turn-helix transcriptional regulator [Lysinibacillus]MBE5085885.1 helix-turn-helix transcriptional regulator [Bacillus thuringiensis]HBJ01164.1 XRE family transcriptional regulator [Lysinibacillus sp.]AMO32081.1 transcriptional regulator [Lysinibacillus sphaericus]AMR88799.1 transcriptional regulator [Lysinibacillus sphaericus]ANA46870.1 transcriptional regulator [Lysinibacillus sphaericus]
MSDFLKLVGEQLRIIRLSKGLSQEEVAERTGKLGFSKGRVSNIEHGQSNITLSTLETLMKALDIPPEELFNFQKLSGVTDIEEKNLMLDIHRSLLRERNLDEVKYVVRITKDFLDTIDSQSKKNSPNGQ